MVKLNDAMLPYCSRGVQRYVSEITSCSRFISERCTGLEMCARGYLSLSGLKVLWSPGQGGSLLCEDQVVTCHDLIDFTFYGIDVKSRVKYRLHKYIYEKAKKIVFISDFTKLQFERVFPTVSTSGVVIRSAYSVGSASPIQENVFPELRDREFFLLITNGMPHKNNKVFLEATASLIKSGVVGVVVGRLDGRASKFMSDYGAGFLNLNGLSRVELDFLITRALAVVSPSLIEGHNLTIAESLAVGTPVIASDIPVHREYYDGRCLFFDPNSVNDLVGLMSGVCDGSVKLIKPDVSRERTWHDVAAEYTDMFDRL